MKKTKTKCYLYTRVSTSMQVDGYSLDAQRDKLRKYAEYEDMVVAGEYSDEGFSGKNIQGRHEFQRMLQDIHPLLSSSPDLHSECSTPTNGVHIPAHGGYPVPILSQSDRESENIYKIPCDSCQCFPAILLFWFYSPFHLPHKAKIHVAYLL